VNGLVASDFNRFKGENDSSGVNEAMKDAGTKHKIPYLKKNIIE
jgi:hypothetical protein